MTLTTDAHAGRSQEDRREQEKSRQQPSQGVAGGDMAQPGSEADAQRSHGELSEKGKQTWREGSGMDGSGKSS